MPPVETASSTNTTTTTTTVNNQKQGMCIRLPRFQKKESNTKTKAKRGEDKSNGTKELRKNIDQINDSLTQLQKFDSELPKQLQSHLLGLNAKLLEFDEKTPPPSTKDVSSWLHEINKEIKKLKYQIPSLPKQSWTSSSVHLHTSSGSNVRSVLLDKLPNLYQSESFCDSSFYKEITDIFKGLDDMMKFYLSCFAVLPEHAVVKRTLLTYLALGEGFLRESDSTNGVEKTPEESVDVILRELHEMDLIKPAMRKRKQEVRSYKMDPLVRSAVIKICQGAGLINCDSNGNVVENFAPSNRAFLVKGEKKSFNDNSHFSQQGEQQSQNLNQEKLVTLFNLNEVSPDLKLLQLANKKDLSIVQWLSKMKSLKVLHLGRWQISAKYHIGVESSEFLEGLKSLEGLKFLSLRGICRIKKLPASIGMLNELIILDVKECHNLEALPEERASLKKLMYMDISNCHFLDRMPKWISSLSELRVLKRVFGSYAKWKLGCFRCFEENERS